MGIPGSVGMPFFATEIPAQQPTTNALPSSCYDSKVGSYSFTSVA